MIKNFMFAFALLSFAQMQSNSASRSRPSTDAARHRPSSALASLKGRLLIWRDYRSGQKHTSIFYSMKPDGSDQRLLLPTTGDVPSSDEVRFNDTQAISRDGRSIAFTSNRRHLNAFRAADATSEIYLYTVETGAVKQLTNCGMGTECRSPRFSPDGKKIVFSLGQSWDADAGYYRIAVMNRDGSEQHFLTEGNKDDQDRPITSSEDARFIGDGSKIYYIKTPVHRVGGHRDYAYVMNANGSKQIRLPEGSTEDHISHDGRQIAFCKKSGEDTEVFVRNISAMQSRSVARFHGVASVAEFSPDGKNVLVVVSEAGSFNAYLVPTNGAAPRLLAKQLSLSRITFSPDGRKAAFTSTRDGDREIFIVNLEGSRQKQITRNTVNDTIVGWL